MGTSKRDRRYGRPDVGVTADDLLVAAVDTADVSETEVVKADTDDAAVRARKEFSYEERRALERREKEALRDAKVERIHELCDAHGLPATAFAQYLNSYAHELIENADFFTRAFEAFAADYVKRNYARLAVTVNSDNAIMLNNTALGIRESAIGTQPLSVPLASPGLTVVFARSNSGKTSFLRLISEAYARAGIEDGLRLFSMQEPESSGVDEVRGFLGQQWRAAVANAEAHTLVIDSIKQTMRLSEPGYPTMSGGIESYFLALLSNLSAAFTAAKRSCIVTVNPLHLADDVVDELKTDLIGSATRVVVLDSTVYNGNDFTVTGKWNDRTFDRKWHSFSIALNASTHDERPAIFENVITHKLSPVGV